MPRLPSSYRAPWWLTNGHAQTVLARSLRRIRRRPYQRRRLELDDGDFLDLDELDDGQGRVAIVLHGLESSSDAPYVRGMARALSENGWDIVAMNFRGCSGEPNRRLRSYHSGVTDDLQAVVADVRARRRDQPLLLIGFSLGGNVVLRYLGERGESVRAQGVMAGVGISVPCHLETCAERFAQPGNRFYMKRFLRFLFEKVRHRQEAFPDALDYDAVLASENFHDFDGRFTAPVHGFASAEDYWTRCSAKAVAESIAVPTLLLNAEDDPFLSPPCHLREEADRNEHLHAEITPHGGHVGYVQFGKDGFYQEARVLAFLRDRA